jgi:hypothetical protein
VGFALNFLSTIVHSRDFECYAVVVFVFRMFGPGTAAETPQPARAGEEL